jgi:HK97 family phage portal protein
MWPDFRSGVPQWKIIDYTTYVNEGFNQNSLIYSSIMYKVRSMTVAPLKAWTGELDAREMADENDPLAQLVTRPNQHQGWVEFQGQGVVYLNVAGNNFIFLDRPSPGKLPEAMYNLRPDRVFVVPGSDKDGKATVLGYLYVPEGKSAYARLPVTERLEALRHGDVTPILAEDILHIKLPNPGDPLEGMGEGLSPISATAWITDTDNSVTKFLKLFFDKGVIVPGYFTSDNPLSDPDIARFKERYKEVYGGFENWAEEIMVTDKGVRYERMGLTFDEMGFKEIDARSESRILGPFGVPGALIGTRLGLDRAIQANMVELRKMFWQDTMVPESKLFETEYQDQLFTDTTFVAYDYSNVPALQEVVLDQREAWREDFKAAAITRNEYRERLQSLGVSLPPDPRGNVYIVQFSTVEVPFGTAIEPAPEPKPPMLEAGEEEAKLLSPPQFKRTGLSHEAKQHLWKQVDGIAESWESRFARRAVAAFDVDERNLLALLNEARGKALQAKQTIDWFAVQRDWDAYFAAGAPENWAEIFHPVIQGVIIDQAQAWNLAFGIQFNVRNLFAEAIAGDFFAEFMEGFSADIIETTRADMGQQIQQALANGWTIDEMSKQLGLTFDRYVDPAFTLEGRRLSDEERSWFEARLPRYRRDMIARTETIRSSNGGSWALFNAWQVVELKEWLATGDDRTRETHLIAWSQYSEGGDPGPIPLNSAFNVGGSSLMYPGDSRGGAGEVINCRCTILPFFTESAQDAAELVEQRQQVEAMLG